MAEGKAGSGRRRRRQGCSAGAQEFVDLGCTTATACILQARAGDIGDHKGCDQLGPPLRRLRPMQNISMFSAIRSIIKYRSTRLAELDDVADVLVRQKLLARWVHHANEMGD